MARDLDDVLTAVGLGGARRSSAADDRSRPPAARRPARRGPILDALGWEPLTFETARRAHAGSVSRRWPRRWQTLEAGGFVVRSDGWLERTATTGG